MGRGDDSVEAAKKKAAELGYPVLVRPSYVLSGAAMRIAYDERFARLKFLKRAADVSSDHPVVISKFIENAREIEIDGVAQRMARSSSMRFRARRKRRARTRAMRPWSCRRSAPISRRFAAQKPSRKKSSKRSISPGRSIFNSRKGQPLQVIECNVRASRSFPFVSKVTGYNFIEFATRAMLGEDVAVTTAPSSSITSQSNRRNFPLAASKAPIRCARVEMASTGEVACFGDSYSEALLKSMMAADFKLPKAGGSVLVSLGKEENKVKLLESIRDLSAVDLKFMRRKTRPIFLMRTASRAKKCIK
jgi:carbamoylphosphate synthase large subunit